MILIGAGGRGQTAEINAKGGAGGAVLDVEIPASYLAAVVAVTVAAGGTNSNGGVGAGTSLSLVNNVVLRAQSGAGGGAAPAAAQALVDVTTLPQPMGLPGGVPTGESTDGAPSPGGGVGGFNPVDSPAYAAGAGSFGLRPPGAAGDVTNAIAGGGGAAPGGGGLGGNPGTNGQPGAACLITYFD
ncbi:hypothetical protein G5V59_00150 [Nocardioides sp. W3-2-3]|uniref:hypothetical protein n=1 Tax=Nocardioides convexus TaxID=2712224 RepID=UPI0024185560|nr:hypothetical protein [Nocardioides convexus]NGZ99385.1 hypothetical protein [Nocardioides convexus]